MLLPASRLATFLVAVGEEDFERIAVRARTVLVETLRAVPGGRPTSAWQGLSAKADERYLLLTCIVGKR